MNLRDNLHKSRSRILPRKNTFLLGNSRTNESRDSLKICPPDIAHSREVKFHREKVNSFLEHISHMLEQMSLRC